MRATAAVPFTTHRIIAAKGRLEDLVDVLADQTELADYPHATDVTQQVLVYESTVAGLDGDELVSLEGEIARALRTGPGIVVFRRAFGAPVVDRRPRRSSR